MNQSGHWSNLKSVRVLFKITALLIAVLLGGCVRSETELLETVEAKIRNDPFILSFKQNMEHAFGCESESKVGSQEMSVYMSLYSVIGLRQADGDRTQIPTVHVIIYCHSAIVSRVYLDLNLWRGAVESFDQFETIEPEMINRIRFEQSDSFAWYISERHEGPSEPRDLSTAAVSTRIWSGFTDQVSSMFPHGCGTLQKSAVVYRESRPMILAGVPYQDFYSTLSCPRPGPSKPGFNFTGRFFPTKGIVLPLEIETGGAYVD